MHYKKLFKITAAILIFMLIFCGCSSSKNADKNKVQILCSNFALYDWTKNITAESDTVEVSLLLKNGVDIHSFQPSADDIIKIKNADLFVYNGGPSEEMLTDITDDSQNVFAAIPSLDTELIESAHTHDEHEYDEHIWLSVKNAINICEKLADAIITVDSQNTALYEDNVTNYISELSALDEELMLVAENSKRNEFVLADRYPFMYLMRDLSLTCHSAFPGCSDETEASFSTVLELAQKIYELDLGYIVTTDGYNNSIAEAVIENSGKSGIEILSLSSMQTITDAEINSGKTYLSAMKENLEVLKKTLN